MWPPLKALNIDYVDICQPSWFKDDPRLGWAFWSYCYTAYVKNKPHEGYTLLANWGQKMPKGCFCFTSNIDGHWLRVLPPGQVLECHGAVTHLQPLNPKKQIFRKKQDEASIRRKFLFEEPADEEPLTEPIGPEFWPVDGNVMETMNLPEWDVTAGDIVEVVLHSGRICFSKWAESGHIPDEDTTWVRATIADDGCSVLYNGYVTQVA